MGYSRKNPHPPPPNGWQGFLTPPLHPDFLDHCDPPSHPDFQGQRPPLPPGFPLFFTSPKFILQAIENKTHVAFGCFRRYSFIIFNKSFTITKIVQKKLNRETQTSIQAITKLQLCNLIF